MRPDRLLEWATSLGAVIIPLHPGEKRPVESNWQNTPLTKERMEQLTEKLGGLNYGLLLGEKSGHLIDVDLDSDWARKLGPRYLPKTLVSWGKSSFPRSHLLYTAPETKSRQTWIDPIDGTTLLELRGDSHQSMVPPSIHPNGEPIIWSNSDVPFESTWEDLVKAGGRLAVAAFLSKHWYRWTGSIHFIVLALAGALLRSGLSEDEIEMFVQSACDLNNDDGTAMQVRAVRDTAKNLDEGKEVTGWPTLREHLGKDSVETIQKWLGVAEDIIPFERTDKYLAEIMVHHFGDKMRFNPERGLWYLWNGSYWEEDKRNDMLNIAPEVSGIIKREAQKLANPDEQSIREKFATSARNLSRMRSVLTIASAHPNVVALSREFDRDTMLLNCLNGTLDLNTQILDNPSREELITKVTGCRYDPSATSPRFDQFLVRIMPNEDTRRYLQKVLGYALTGMTREEKFWIWYGPSANNGKSTLSHVLEAVLQEYSMRASKDSFMKQPNGRAIRDDLAHMDGVRLITLSEPSEKDVFDTALLKDFTGGDKIRARHLYGREFQFNPKGKLMIPTNFLPGASALDPGLWRRLYVIPFNVHIPVGERDQGLKEYLVNHELSGILNWLVRGVQLYLIEGLGVPAEVDIATADYRKNNDSVGQFIEERIEWDEDGRVERQLLYSSYSDYCRAMGLRRVSSPELAKVLETKGVTTKTLRGAKRWVGIKLRPDAGDALFRTSFNTN